MGDLSAQQQKALDAFVAAHEAITELETEAPRRQEGRQKALRRAIDAGVPRGVLVEATGLNRSRIYQLIKQLDD